MSETTPYNPLDKRNLGASVAEAMLSRKPVSLGELERFNGAGVYAIYYAGDFEAYRPISELNRNGNIQAPIYVGKAVPPGARKGGLGLLDSQNQALFKRLSEHAESINLARNLKIEDFFC
ncbi:MAG: Eco29kI family restriction endonuclease, partial [Methylomonas sp.]